MIGGFQVNLVLDPIAAVVSLEFRRWDGSVDAVYTVALDAGPRAYIGLFQFCLQLIHGEFDVLTEPWQEWLAEHWHDGAAADAVALLESLAGELR